MCTCLCSWGGLLTPCLRVEAWFIRLQMRCNREGEPEQASGWLFVYLHFFFIPPTPFPTSPRYDDFGGNHQLHLRKRFQQNQTHQDAHNFPSRHRNCHWRSWMLSKCFSYFLKTVKGHTLLIPTIHNCSISIVTNGQEPHNHGFHKPASYLKGKTK